MQEYSVRYGVRYVTAKCRISCRTGAIHAPCGHHRCIRHGREPSSLPVLPHLYNLLAFLSGRLLRDEAADASDLRRDIRGANWLRRRYGFCADHTSLLRSSGKWQH